MKKDIRIQYSPGLRGVTAVPGDKSISHRAVMLGSLAAGETVVDNFLAGEDCLSTIGCFQKMGVAIEGPVKGRVRISGQGLDGLSEPAGVLDAGNSGTTMRLLLGILAGQPFFSVITGDESLRGRPMARVAGPLRQMGATVLGRRGGSLAPLAVQGGALKNIDFISPVASAQVKSAVLLAGLFAGGETSVTEPSRSRDHTERMLLHFGARVEVEGNTTRVKGRPGLEGRKIVVPGDISSAAFLMVAAALVPGSDVTITGVGVNPTRDGIIEVLQAMGTDLTLHNRRDQDGEPVADIRVRYAGRLTGVTVAGPLIPRLIDEIPVLAVAAAAADGITEIRDAAELKVKESNRIAAVAGLLSRFGAHVNELPDGMQVRGVPALRGAECDSLGDHRIAMAAAVAGLTAKGETLVRGADCMDVSFPGFDHVLNALQVE
jgi:3-phosphoshikimate 1-carboxyvinyltransferase